MHLARLPVGLALALAATAQGHDLWIERQGSLLTLQYGHEHSAHAGTGRLEYRPEHVRDALCFDGHGRELAAAIDRHYPLSLRGDCRVSWFVLSSGYWSKTPYGNRNLPRAEAAQVLDSWLSIESAKRLDSWDDALARPLTRDLEIVPLADPLRLKAGDKVRLAVFLEGKPAAGATVAYFGQPRGVTGGDGRINVRLQQPGSQLVQASLERPLRDGKADRVVHATALQFELGR